MLRLHFTLADLASLRIADRAKLDAEVLLSLHVAHLQNSDIRFRRWRRAVRPTPAAAVLSQLCGPSLLPAFLGASVKPDWRDTSGGAMEDDPDYRRAYVRNLSDSREITPFGYALGRNDRHARRLALRALGSYQKSAVDAWMPQIQAQVATEHHTLAHLAAGGTGRMLDALHPLITWDPPVLSVYSHVDSDVHLKGRGLLIQPTVFAGGRPWMSGYDATHYQLTLYVPLRRQLPLGEHEPESPRTTAALLGRTRSAVLEMIADSGPHTTGELARRAGCSPATASEHATVLRASGLITTIRVGQQVHHAITDLGEALISAGKRSAWT